MKSILPANIRLNSFLFNSDSIIEEGNVIARFFCLSILTIAVYCDCCAAFTEFMMILMKPSCVHLNTQEVTGGR